ncbi:MAG TPA: ABC transporter permease [Terracidiphilus sp.]|jgi:putative ABC transport system permease protein
MRWLDQLRIRLLMLFRRRESTRLDDELHFHLDRQIAENLAAGMSPQEARYAALRTFGNPALLRDKTRASWSWNWLESLLRDIKYGFRTLRRTPGFAAIAIVVIALGIGANVALFTVVRAVLLKPLPFADPGRLVRLYESSADGKFPLNSNAAGIYSEWKRLNHSFTDMAIMGDAGYNLSGDGGQLPEKIRAAVFSANLLPTLGIQPALGRNFTAADDQPSANPTVILSWGLWKRRFGGNPNVLNQTILLDTRPYTIIGVMPSWFALPNAAAQLWTPIHYNEPPNLMKAIDDHDFHVIARLKPGVLPAQAVNELSILTRHIHDANLSDPFVSIAAQIKPLLDSMVRNVETSLYILLGATGCLLLIACLNVANLLVARAAARRKELAIRSAMGGGRMRLVRQHLIESLLLSLAGGTVGFLLAIAALQWFITARHEMARSESITIDWFVVAFAVALVLVFAAFAGILSAFSMRSDQPLSALQESSRGQSAGRARTRLRATLLTIEVSLTVVLLIGAGLLIKSYSRLRSTELGCLTQNVLKLDINLPQARYKQPAKINNFLQSLLTQVQNIPGITAAAFIVPVVPGDGYGGDNGFVVVEHPPLPQGKMQDASHRWSDPGYFNAIGIPILRGHTFTSDQQPGHATQVIINDTLARQFFPGEDPIGKHLRTLGERTFEIVAVVGDTRTAIGDPVPPMMYFPIYAVDDVSGATLVVRSTSDVRRFAIPIQRLVSQMDRDLPVSDVLTMDQVIDNNIVDNSFDATLVTAFAAISLALAAVGLFGVLSFIVAQRTSEIGIRIALGAQRTQVLKKVLADGLRPALIGLAFGLAGSAATVDLIKSMLYHTDPIDPVVFAAVAIALFFVAVIACMLPAWRASRLDPMQALRTE